MKPQFSLFLLLFVALGYSRQIPSPDKLKGDQGIVELSLHLQNEEFENPEFSVDDNDEGKYQVI